MKLVRPALYKVSAFLFFFMSFLLLVLVLSKSAYGNDPVATEGVRTQGAVSFISGGIGEDEKEKMRALAKQYNFRMTFATTSGEHLADVKVIVRDNKGRMVLDTVSDGPCVFAAVPAGTYKVTAVSDGKTITKPANIAEKRGASLYFHFSGMRDNSAERRTELREENGPRATQNGCV